MKKKPISVLSVLLTVVMLFIGMPHIAADTPDDLLVGDADGDHSVTILDATVIQRRLADMDTLAPIEEFLADTDGDDMLTIVDATLIQRRLAELNAVFWRDTVTPFVPETLSMTADTDYPNRVFIPNVRDNTSVTVYLYTELQITFSANQYYQNRLYENTYTVYLDGEKLLDRSAQQYFKHTFDDTGKYTVTIAASNLFGEGVRRSFEVNVIDSPDRPYISDAVYDYYDHTVRATAKGGAGGYRYKYYIRHVMPESPTELPQEPQQPPDNDVVYHFEPREDGTFELVSDYTASDYIVIPRWMLDEHLVYTLYVKVIDNNGVESTLSYVSRTSI